MSICASGRSFTVIGYIDTILRIQNQSVIKLEINFKFEFVVLDRLQGDHGDDSCLVSDGRHLAMSGCRYVL